MSALGRAVADSEYFSFYQNRGSHEIAHTDHSRSNEMWYPKDPDGPVHCYVFCVGTGAHPGDYAATAEHLASHGMDLVLTFVFMTNG